MKPLLEILGRQVNLSSNADPMTITIEVADAHEAGQVLKLLKSLDISAVHVQSSPTPPVPTITAGDKSQDPRALFGIWKDQSRTLEQVREAGWKRNWDI